MKEIRGMKRGVKLEAQPNNSQRIRELDVELKNLQMAGRISQMMVQQLMTNLQNATKDLGKAYGIINELQYKILAMQKAGVVQGTGAFDMTALNAVAEELRLKDFIEASDREDVEGNFTVGDKVQEDSTVILTSSAPNDAGLFRSRIKLAECSVPVLIQSLQGQSLGTKVKCMLNDVEHEIELLGVRNPPPSAPVVEEVPAAEQIPVETAATSEDTAH